MARTKSVDVARAAVDNAVDEYLRARFAEAVSFTQNGVHPAKRRLPRRLGRKPGPKPGSRRAARNEAPNDAPAETPKARRVGRPKKSAES